MRPGVRRGMLAVILAITLLAAWWPVDDDPLIRSGPRKQASGERKQSGPMPAATGASGAAQVDASVGTPGPDLFPAQSWAPPLPPPAPPAKPQAPPLPFAFGGRYVESGKIAVFLKEGDRIHTARAGDTIAENYRIESIEKQAVNIRYLPLQVLQILPISEIAP